MERMTPDTIDFNSLSKKQLVELVIAKYNDCFRLEEENKKLKEENRKLREELSAYDREFRDEDKKAKNIFMEEDTLQELRDIGEL